MKNLMNAPTAEKNAPPRRSRLGVLWLDGTPWKDMQT